MNRRAAIEIAAPMAVLASAILFGGCEELVDPAHTTDRVFTVYGVLDPTADVQAARVFEIDDLLEVLGPDPIDARVFSTDLDAGDRVEWQDSLVLYQDSSYGHVFWSPFRAEFEHSYRLEVVRSDDRMAEATVTVPPETQASIEEPDSTDFDLRGKASWPLAPNVIHIEVEYLSNVGSVTVSYAPITEVVDGVRSVQIYFRRDTRAILETARINRISPVYIRGVVLRAVIASVDWVAPDGLFNPDIIVEPGTLNNVTDGFGFIGAGYESTTFWMPSDGVLRAGGFDIEPPG